MNENLSIRGYLFVRVEVLQCFQLLLNLVTKFQHVVVHDVDHCTPRERSAQREQFIASEAKLFLSGNFGGTGFLPCVVKRKAALLLSLPQFVRTAGSLSLLLQVATAMKFHRSSSAPRAPASKLCKCKHFIFFENKFVPAP